MTEKLNKELKELIKKHPDLKDWMVLQFPLDEFDKMIKYINTIPYAYAKPILEMLQVGNQYAKEKKVK